MKTDGTNPPGQGIFGLIDINCHILPGTEDGPDNFREAAEMLRIAYDKDDSCHPAIQQEESDNGWRQTGQTCGTAQR